ncbi:hypothetical protein [Arthrobacter glacialis]|uniref:hypothetical protein n=1 Tax=Arthrobacter glacialis TaxID=1664 RepID=UPI001FAF1FF8|nr:hypothetical protein [Arthrobacter glacialis]
MDEAEQNMLRADVIVVEHAGLFLGQHNNASGSIIKSLKYFATLLATAYSDATQQLASVSISFR